MASRKPKELPALDEKTHLEIVRRIEAEQKTSRVPENESNEDRFRRIASNRLSNACEAMDLIAKMGQSAGQSYDYSGEQVDKIVNILQGRVDGIRIALTNPGKKRPAGIQL